MIKAGESASVGLLLETMEKVLGYFHWELLVGSQPGATWELSQHGSKELESLSPNAFK